MSASTIADIRLRLFSALTLVKLAHGDIEKLFGRGSSDGGLPMQSDENVYHSDISIVSSLLDGRDAVQVRQYQGSLRPYEIDGFLQVFIDGVSVFDPVEVSALPLFWSRLIQGLVQLAVNPPTEVRISTLSSGEIVFEPVRGDRVVLRHLGPQGVRVASQAVDRRLLISSFRAAAEQFFRDFEPLDRDGIGNRTEGEIAALRDLLSR